MAPHKHSPGSDHGSAAVFGALGDPTRLALIAMLAGGAMLSITRLTQGSPLTRQAITKHLRVLEDAGVVRCERRGREAMFTLAPDRLAEARASLDAISRQWDDALARLKSFVED